MWWSCGLKSVEYGSGFVGMLDLSSNFIKEEGMKYLQQFPHQLLQHIKTLNFSVGGFGQIEFDGLADTIPLLSTLESLDICNNPGGNESTVEFLQALGKHQRLETLEMQEVCLMSWLYQRWSNLQEA